MKNLLLSGLKTESFMKGGEKLDSKAMNDILYSLDNREDIPYKSCIGEKAIPYIGWFWRTVDFNKDYCMLGVLPVYDSEYESNDKPKVGFMENNKWNYYEFRIDGEIWKMLKKLIAEALVSFHPKDFEAVDHYMQGLLKDSGYQGRKITVDYHC